MRCPKCHTDTLLPLEHDGVELDFCSGCKGVWFDKGETAFYVETVDDLPDLESALGAGRPVERACPHCDKPMVEVRYVPDADLLLDVCAGCSGIFLDGGELRRLEQIAVRLQAAGKVQRTLKALEGMGYMVLGAGSRRK